MGRAMVRLDKALVSSRATNSNLKRFGGNSQCKYLGRKQEVYHRWRGNRGS